MITSGIPTMLPLQRMFYGDSPLYVVIKDAATIISEPMEEHQIAVLKHALEITSNYICELEERNCLLNATIESVYNEFDTRLIQIASNLNLQKISIDDVHRMCDESQIVSINPTINGESE